MSEDKITEIEITKFTGIDSESSPLVLPIGTTDDCLNVFGGKDGSILRRRPGLKAASAALPGVIYDMVSGAMYSTQSGTATSPDSIHALTLNSATTVRYSFVDLTDYSLLSDTTDITVPNGQAVYSRLLMTDANHLLVTPMTAGANWNVIEHYQNTTPWYRTTTYAAPSATETYQYGAFHRLHTLWAGQGTRTVTTSPRKVIFSNFDAPVTFTATDNFTIPGEGRYPGVTGLHQAGDVTYIGTGKETFMLSGASSETFRVDRVQCDFGFGGTRTWAYNGEMSVGFTSGRAATTSQTSISTSIDNLGILSGGAGKKVGAPILTYLRTGTDSNLAKCEAWPTYNAHILCVDTLAPYLLDSNGSFWKWSCPSSAGNFARCFCFADDLMHIAGGSDKKIYYFDEATGSDPATAPAYYWTKLFTSRMLGLPLDRPFQIVYVRLYGTQTSGTAPTVQIDTNEAGSYSTAVSCTLAKSGTNVDTTGTKNGYAQRVKINFGANAVGCNIQKVTLGVKPFPGR